MDTDSPLSISTSLFISHVNDLQSFILTKQAAFTKTGNPPQDETNSASSDPSPDSLSDFYIQEQLDTLNYYIKHIPKDAQNLFRAISDALYFTTACWEQELDFIRSNILRCMDTPDFPIQFDVKQFISEVYGADSLLNFASDEVICDTLLQNAEITLLLACYFNHMNLKVLGYDHQCTLKELTLDLGFDNYFHFSIIDDGRSFDNIYSKHYIYKKAAYCQRIVEKIVDVVLGESESHQEILDTVSAKTSFSFYKNVEFNEWKRATQEHASNYTSHKKVNETLQRQYRESWNPALKA